MKLIIASSIGICLLVFVSCSLVKYMTRQEIFNSTSKSTVRLETESGFGSGTVVAVYPKFVLILTCAHVVHDYTTLTVLIDHGDRINSYGGLVEKVDRDRDLALVIGFGVSEVSPLPIAKDEPPLYSPVYILGSPFGHHAVTEGVLSYKNDETRQFSFNWLITGGFIAPGISGGTIVNNKAQLICVPETVYTYKDVPLTQLGTCIPLREIKYFLKDYKNITVL